MGVPRMPASRAEHRITRDPGRGTLAPDLFRDRNGNARGTVCQGHVLARLDATLASAGNGRRQEQAFGAPGLPGSVATGQKTSVRSAHIKSYETIKRLYVIKKVGFRYRQAEIAGIAAVERLERTAGLASAIRWLRNAHVTEHFGVEKPTQKLRSFFSRWSIKFSAEYYEAKERQASGIPSLDSSKL